MFNATFNNISVILCRSVLLVEETGVPGEKPLTCRKSLTNFITLCCIKYTLPWTWFKLATLVVIGTDCTGSCKSNYHAIMTMTAWNHSDLCYERMPRELIQNCVRILNNNVCFKYLYNFVKEVKIIMILSICMDIVFFFMVNE